LVAHDDARFSHTKSPIVAPLGSGAQTSNTFRCALDKDDSFRNNEQNDGVNGPYYYSYSMTSYGITANKCDGMSSIVDTANAWYPFKFSAIRNPVLKIMLAEEQSSRAGFDVSDATGEIINDGRWVATGADRLTSRHSKKANAGWADGHVSLILWKDAQNAANSQPNL